MQHIYYHELLYAAQSLSVSSAGVTWASVWHSPALAVHHTVVSMVKYTGYPEFTYSSLHYCTGIGRNVYLRF